MKLTTIAFSLLLSTLAYATDVSITSVNEVAVMQQNANGTYSVVCTNGNRETVSDLDLSLNNVCPNRKKSEPSNILSLQKREDGQFDVVCKDFKRLVATTEQIIAGSVCQPPPPPPVVLEDGEYERGEGNTNYCPQRIETTHEDGVLKGLVVTFLSPCGNGQATMSCEGTTCKDSDSGDHYVIEVQQPTRYRFSRGEGYAIFDKSSH